MLHYINIHLIILYLNIVSRSQGKTSEILSKKKNKNKSNRGVAQVVAHQTGGLGVASSSLVTPTKKGGFLTVFLFAQKAPQM